MHWLFFTDYWLRYTLFFFSEGVRWCEKVFSGTNFWSRWLMFVLGSGGKRLVRAAWQALTQQCHEAQSLPPLRCCSALWPEAGLIHVIWSEKWFLFAALLALWWWSVGLLDGDTLAAPWHHMTDLSIFLFLDLLFSIQDSLQTVKQSTIITFFALHPSFATWHTQTQYFQYCYLDNLSWKDYQSTTGLTRLRLPRITPGTACAVWPLLTQLTLNQAVRSSHFLWCFHPICCGQQFLMLPPVSCVPFTELKLRPAPRPQPAWCWLPAPHHCPWLEDLKQLSHWPRLGILQSWLTAVFTEADCWVPASVFFFLV